METSPLCGIFLVDTPARQSYPTHVRSGTRAWPVAVILPTLDTPVSKAVRT